MKNIRSSLGDRKLAALLGLLGLLVGCSADNSNDAAPSPLNASESVVRASPRHGVATPGARGHAPPRGPRGHAPPPQQPDCGSGGHANSGPGGGNASNDPSTGSGGAPSSAGAYTAGVSGWVPAVCGDGRWSGGEECDDGNSVSGDGCSSSCQQESGWLCTQLGSACRQPRCGDSFMDTWIVSSPPSSSAGFGAGGASANYYTEQCDDGNPVSGDGCSATCELEPGWICADPGVACHQPTCGDGIRDNWFVLNSAGVGGASSTGGSTGVAGAGSYGTYYFEECDDSNQASGDGCSSQCVTESGWLCPTPGTACHQPACGNGFIDFTASAPGAGGGGSFGTTEQCDDLNAVSGDGCSAQCTIEPGYACHGPGACYPAVCGDGVVDWPTEQCDDGNQVANDGCNQCVYRYPDGSAGFGNTAAGAPAH